MTTVPKPAGSLLPGEVITEFPFEGSKNHRLGDAVRWRVLALPVDRLGEWVVDCRDLSDGGDVRLSLASDAKVVVEPVDPRLQWVTGAGMDELVRLAVKVAATAPAAFDRAVAGIETSTAAKETTR